ncbi:hypothetical protein R1flu_003129 [Riccia fluitans]|uniref:Uncharacterized protein n=1 Tax=Riccia fluitans TaxID=41844 RepID=A0ABD1YBV7_9MARC
MAVEGATLLSAGCARFRNPGERAALICSSSKIDGSVSRVSTHSHKISVSGVISKECFGAALFCGQDGEKKIRSGRKLGSFSHRDAGNCLVRAEAEVADGSAGSNTGIGVSGSARKGRNDDGGKEKARALSDSTIYPVMRVYRNDLCSLEVTGDAKAWEVVDAMAADGGFTASEELSKGRSLMTVETIIPGRSDDHSTVSTKLLAPTELVNKRAKLMWTKRGAQRMGSSSGSALALAFQGVVMQRVLAFDLRIQGTGTVRDMANLANEKETRVVASLESRDGKVLEGLAEAVCSYLLTNIRDAYERTGSGKGGISGLIPFWRRSKQVCALDKAICVSPLSDNEVWKNTKKILEESTFLRDRRTTQLVRNHQSWWPLSDALSASNFLADEDLRNFSNEFVPIHKIEIDMSRLQVEAKGWQTTNKRDHVLELQLTHAQLVDMADMMDLFYEDGSTVPTKNLKSGLNLNVSQNTRSKVAKTVWTVVVSALAGGILIVGLLVASRIRGSSTSNSRTSSLTSSIVSETSFKSKWCTPKYNRQVLLPSNNDIPPEEIEALCTQVVLRMKDVFKLDGVVQSSPGKGAWLGSDITSWGRTESEEDLASPQTSGNYDRAQLGDSQLNKSPKVGRARPLEEVVLLYQVMLSRDGKVVGFQPGNKPAIGYWLNYPFAEELHQGRKLGAGLIEPGLRYVEPPVQPVAIELLCRPQSETPSIAARPLEISSSKQTSEEF